MCANAYLRVIFKAGCLGPNTSRRKAVRLHRMPRKQKAAITLSRRMVWGLTQYSEGTQRHCHNKATTFISAVGFNRIVLETHHQEAWGQCSPGHPPLPALVSDRCPRGPEARRVLPEQCTAQWWIGLRAGPTPGSAQAAWAKRCLLFSSVPQGQQNPAGRT